MPLTAFDAHSYCSSSWSAVALAAGLVLVVAGVLRLCSKMVGGRRTAAWMRLDWFLPFLRKKAKQGASQQDGWLVAACRRVLPASLFADRDRRRPGLFRKLLRRLGPSVLSSPFRRLVQVVCFLLFFILFFVVCWPYSARPEQAGRVSAGWRFVEVDAAGVFRFAGTVRPDWIGTAGRNVHLAQQTGQGDVAYGGAFSLLAAEGGQLLLEPQTELTPRQFDAFLIGAGPWTIGETAPGRWPSHYTDDLAAKQWVPAELFLIIDPLVSLSTAIASRSWVWSLTSAAVILIFGVLIPRGFCGYICPLGTLIDLFDWALAGRVKRFRVAESGWWVHIKYYLLAATLVSALGGVLISGYVAAIPVITRALLFLGEPLQSGVLRGWRLVPPLQLGHFISIALFLAVLGLGFLRPRFWCKYICPSGAVFSLANLFRATERKVESTCIHCNKCVEICPFDAIKPDFTTRVTDCTLCQTCGGVCPTQAIKFVERWNAVELKVENDPPSGDTPIGRRGFLSLAAGSTAAVVGGASLAAATRAAGAHLRQPHAVRPVRPPGSVPEAEFLQMCIRCGECFKVCPNNVLQVEGFQQGLEGLWAPLVNADWAGCEPSCNACGQVCPTGAIRALPLEEKKVARIGLAIVNRETCLPLAAREACDLCVVECNAAGYRAIEFMQVHTAVDDDGRPIAGSGYLAPVVLAEKCVGCGLCQTRCYLTNARHKGLLHESAIVVEAGEGREDRLMDGSYLRLREQEAKQQPTPAEASEYLIPGTDAVFPDAPAEHSPGPGDTDDPFGLGADAK